MWPYVDTITVRQFWKMGNSLETGYAMLCTPAIDRVDCLHHRSAAFLRNSNDLKQVTGSWGHGRQRIRVSVVFFATPGAATSRQLSTNICHFAAVCKYLSLCSCLQIFVTLQLQTSTLNPQLYRLEMGEMRAASFSAAQLTFGSGQSFPWPIRSWANLTGNFVAAKVTLSP